MALEISPSSPPFTENRPFKRAAMTSVGCNSETNLRGNPKKPPGLVDSD